MGFRAALARDMVEGRAQKALLLSLLRRSLKAPHHLVYQTPRIPKRRPASPLCARTSPAVSAPTHAAAPQGVQNPFAQVA